jgi:hypothetical protein
MEYLAILFGFIGGAIAMYMYIVPAADFGKPICPKCNGSGKWRAY